jgi:hypothetical protein
MRGCSEYSVRHGRRIRQRKNTQSAIGIGNDNTTILSPPEATEKNNVRVLELPLALEKTTRTDLGESESTTQTTRGAGKTTYARRQMFDTQCAKGAGKGKHAKRGAKYFDPP